MRSSEGLLQVSSYICVVSCRTLLFTCYPCFISRFSLYLLCLLISPSLSCVVCSIQLMFRIIGKRAFSG
ncbi:hypothetical protein B0H14DRAFT_2847783 [Mycena olivaceomarginata]|nr:hypothetical protein B0H14DRAFT_2847783 [Mycena olivaceomarginata]